MRPEFGVLRRDISVLSKIARLHKVYPNYPQHRDHIVTCVDNRLSDYLCFSRGNDSTLLCTRNSFVYTLRIVSALNRVCADVVLVSDRVTVFYKRQMFNDDDV